MQTILRGFSFTGLKKIGRKKRKNKTKEIEKLKKEISKQGLELLIPEEFREAFEIYELVEKDEEWNLNLVEKKDQIPKKLKGKDVVLNGYLKKVEIVDFPFKGKIMYIRFYRRRWKERGSKNPHNNEYKFHKEGMKATNAFGDFLKEITGQERSRFFRTWNHIRHIRQEDCEMVSDGIKRI